LVTNRQNFGHFTLRPKHTTLLPVICIYINIVVQQSMFFCCWQWPVAEYHTRQELLLYHCKCSYANAPYCIALTLDPFWYMSQSIRNMYLSLTEIIYTPVLFLTSQNDITVSLHSRGPFLIWDHWPDIWSRIVSCFFHIPSIHIPGYFLKVCQNCFFPRPLQFSNQSYIIRNLRR
jgi:hypothetical protein